jgi:hypothetical protein
VFGDSDSVSSGLYIIIVMYVYIIRTNSVRYRSFSSLTTTRVEFNTGREELLYKLYNIIMSTHVKDR